VLRYAEGGTCAAVELVSVAVRYYPQAYEVGHSAREAIEPQFSDHSLSLSSCGRLVWMLTCLTLSIESAWHDCHTRFGSVGPHLVHGVVLGQVKPCNGFAEKEQTGWLAFGVRASCFLLFGMSHNDVAKHVPEL
jgi:hypothetical protein